MLWPAFGDPLLAFPIPIEITPTSELMCGTVNEIEDHPFGDWLVAPLHLHPLHLHPLHLHFLHLHPLHLLTTLPFVCLTLRRSSITLRSLGRALRSPCAFYLALKLSDRLLQVQAQDQLWRQELPALDRLGPPRRLSPKPDLVNYP